MFGGVSGRFVLEIEGRLLSRFWGRRRGGLGLEGVRNDRSLLVRLLGV